MSVEQVQSLTTQLIVTSLLSHRSDAARAVRGCGVCSGKLWTQLSESKKQVWKDRADGIGTAAADGGEEEEEDDAE